MPKFATCQGIAGSHQTYNNISTSLPRASASSFSRSRRSSSHSSVRITCNPVRARDIPTYTTPRDHSFSMSLMPTRTTASFSRPLKPEAVDQVMWSRAVVPRAGTVSSVSRWTRGAPIFGLLLVGVAREKDGDLAGVDAFAADVVDDALEVASPAGLFGSG